MQKVLVIQSAPSPTPLWQRNCMASVSKWAKASGYDYRLLDDELFAQVPDWYMAKVRGRMPIAADLGRLQWAKRLLSDGYSWVLWFDADMLIFAPEQLKLRLEQSCVFGQEHWVQPKRGGSGRWTVRKNIHNAFAAFPRDCPVLPFLIDLILRMMARVDADHIAPQMMGPKLLSTLHNLAAFQYQPDIGALAPEVLADIAGNTERSGALQALCAAQPQPLVAANLCASLAPRLGDTEAAQNKVMQQIMQCLLQCHGGLSEPEDLYAVMGTDLGA